MSLLRWRLPGILAFLLFASACATHRFTPPPVPPVPVPPAEAEGIWRQATRACADLQSFNAEIRPSGRVADARVRGLTLFVGVTSQGQLGIDAEAANQLFFSVKGTTGEATLWLPREDRFVVAPADRILGAIVGLELGADRLLSLLSGCLATDRAVSRADRLREVLRITTPDSVAYLEEEEDEEWVIRAGQFGDVLIDYPEWEGDWPAEIRIRTAEARAPAVDLSLDIVARAVDRDFPPGAFEVHVPAGAVQAAVEDLRLIGSE